MENEAKSVTSDSVIGKNDVSNSMYFSFNSDIEDKTLAAEELIIDVDDSDTTENDISVVSTVKKSGEPSHRVLTKNILTDSKIHSSTPTKYFSPVTITVSEYRNSSVGISLLPIKYLEPSENKENVSNIYESSCTNIVNEMNLHLEQLKICNGNSTEKPPNRKGLIVLPEDIISRDCKLSVTKQLKSVANNSESIKLSTVRKTHLLNEPDLLKNRPSRISDNKSPPISKKIESQINCKNSETTNAKVVGKNETRRLGKGIYFENLVNSTESSKLKIEKRRTIYAAYTFPKRKSTEGNNSIKRQPRFSVSKTTLNSPGIINKNIRRTIHKQFEIRNNIGQNKLLLNDNDKKSKPKIIHNNKHESTSASATSLKSVRNKKTETKVFPIISSERSKEFRAQSIYETHKNSHQLNNKHNENKCKFCDKKFAIPKALHIHLLENCLKISAAARKKLFINEESSNPRKYMTTLKIPTIKISTSKPVPTLTSRAITCNESDSASSGINLNIESMPPPSSTKIRKKMPHSGIYRTPTKLLNCQLCPENFNNVYDFADHTLSHSQAEAN